MSHVPREAAPRTAISDAPYQTLKLLPQGAVTGAGAVDAARAPGTPNDVAAPGGNELFYMARVSAREFLVRAVEFWLYATAGMCFLAYLGIANAAGNDDKKFLTALSIVINVVAAMHYRFITSIRGYRGADWYYDNVQESKPWKPWQPLSAAAREVAVDAVRYGDWLITMPFLTVKLYTLVNRDPLNSGYNGLFNDVETAAAISAIMILLGAYARIGCDEIWDTRSTCAFVSGLVAFAGSCACLVVLLIDLGNAAHSIENGYFLRSFFYCWIGYPLVAIVAIVWRLSRKCKTRGSANEYYGGYPESLSLIKDIAFGMLDCYAKGFFALWSAYTCFNQTLFNTRDATPHT